MKQLKKEMKQNGGMIDMKCENSSKVLIYAICGFVAVAAAVTAIYLFRNEIADFFVDIKARIDEKRLTRDAEFADYEDV